MIDLSVSRFRDKYIDKTKAYGVEDKSLRWYVRHVEAYIKTHKNVNLAQHLPECLEKYLNEKGRNNRLKDWQFRQIIEALRILFTKMVQAEQRYKPVNQGRSNQEQRCQTQKGKETYHISHGGQYN